MNPVALLTYLEPFQSYFSLPGVSEICINRPGNYGLNSMVDLLVMKFLR